MSAVCRVVVMAVLLGLAQSAGAAAPRQDLPRILQVEHARKADPAGGPAPVYLPKFADALQAAPRETFVVRWDASSSGLPAGALLTFEYRQERSERIRFLHVKYPFAVAGQRKAVFEVAGAAARAGGPVTAWRVRVVQGGRALAESRSSSWRTMEHASAGTVR